MLKKINLMLTSKKQIIRSHHKWDTAKTKRWKVSPLWMNHGTDITFSSNLDTISVRASRLTEAKCLDGHMEILDSRVDFE